MSYSIQEFRACNPVLLIGDHEFEISLMTLQIDGKISEKFESVNHIHIYIRKEPLNLFRITWILLKNKRFFDYSFVNFKAFVMKQAETAKISGAMYNCLNESIKRSTPVIKNAKMNEELFKIQQAVNGGSGEICYAKYYDMLAKRYGYTITDFFNLTMKELYILLRTSNKEEYADLEIQAALQGRKLKPSMSVPEIDEKTDKALDDDAQSLLARLTKDYENKKAIKDV